MNVVTVLEIEDVNDPKLIWVKTGMQNDGSDIERIPETRIVHSGTDGFIGGFLRKQGNDLVGDSVESVVRHFVDYLEHIELEGIEDESD